MGKQRIVLEFDFDRSPLSACVRNEEGEVTSHSIEAIEELTETLRRSGLPAEVGQGRIWNVARITISPSNQSGDDAVLNEVDALLRKWRSVLHEQERWDIGQGRLHICEEFVRDLEALRAKHQ